MQSSVNVSPDRAPAHRRPLPWIGRLFSLLVCLALSLFAPFTAGAQEAPAQDPPVSEQDAAANTFGEEVSVRWVLVPVAVRSSSRYVRGLEVKDFRLSVDGRAIPIAAFDLGREAPTSIVFLQDLSGSMDNGGKLEASRQALSRLLEQVEPRDELSLATFAGKRLAIEIPFTRELEPFLGAMRGWRGYGTTTLHDAVAWLPDIAIDGKNGKRAVILVTDGQDNASAVDPETARALVRRADLPVYVIGLFLDQNQVNKPPSSGVSVPQLLNSLAYRSGGQYFEVTKPKQIIEAVDAILDDLRLRYVLSFPTGGVGDSTYRELSVEVGRGSRYQLTYRRGYRGTLPDALVPD